MYGQINKLFIIGNGFDLAHKLNTRYCDFINYIWENEKKSFINAINSHHDYRAFYYDGNLLSLKIPVSYYRSLEYSFNENAKGYKYFKDKLKYYPMKNNLSYNDEIETSVKNNFIQNISDKSSLVNWVDIEEEYYSKLKDCLNSRKKDDIKNLNIDFDNLRSSLKYYLSLEIKNDVSIIPQIIDKLRNILQPELVSGNQTLNSNDRVLFLNFNYTNTNKQYIDYFRNIIPQVIDNINIHGELNNANNPIIFGYGDELDEDHKKIENINDKNYLENEKSVNYAKTPNYRNLLGFIDAYPFNVYIMGHSYGKSDRTLLNSIFEHKNCMTIKSFYYIDEEGINDQDDRIMNLYLHFKDKSLFRAKVIDKTNCEPLV
jgi:hypothetical protein